MSFRPKLLEHVGTPKIRAFRVDGKEMMTCCVLARWQHMRISGDPFASQIVSELGTSQRHLPVRIGGNSTRARNRFAATDFDIDEASSIRSPAFLPSLSYFYQEFCSFGHFSVWTQQQSKQDEMWKHATIDICRSYRDSAF